MPRNSKLGLQEQINQDAEESSEEELEALDPDALRELADDLEITGEQTELLRQYAEMEREVSQRAASLDRSRAEQLLQSAGLELSSGTSTQKLGEKLNRKDFEAASKELGNLKPINSLSSKDPSEAELDQKRAELERLKSAASKLGEAARRYRATSENLSASSENGNTSLSNVSDHSGEGMSTEATTASSANSESDALEISDKLANEMERLDKISQELSECMSQCENGNCSGSDVEKLMTTSQKASDTVSELQRLLQELDAQQRARSRLQSLAKSLGQCQGAVTGQCQSPFTSNALTRNGGKNAGQGSSQVENTTTAPEHGEMAQIKGIKNQSGSSTVSIEDTDSGTGISRRAGGDSPK